MVVGAALAAQMRLIRNYVTYLKDLDTQQYPLSIILRLETVSKRDATPRIPPL
jgi:hypothetical protein